MAVLQFGKIACGFLLFFSLSFNISEPTFMYLISAFGGGADNPHLPHNHEVNQVVYSGTHDNDTVSCVLALNDFT